MLSLDSLGVITFKQQYNFEKIVLRFEDGAFGEYYKSTLKNIPFFERCFGGPYIESGGEALEVVGRRKEGIDLIIALFCKGEHLYDVVDEKLLCEPSFYSSLEELIDYYFCQEVEKVKGIIIAQIQSLPVGIIFKIRSQCDESILSGGYNFFLKVVELACNTFSDLKTHEKANEELYDNQKKEIEQEQAIAILKTFLGVLNSNDPAFTNIYSTLPFVQEGGFDPKKAMNERMSKIIKNKYNQQSSLRPQFLPLIDKSKKKSPESLLKVLRSKKRQDPYLPCRMSSARRLWRVYKETVLNTLQYQFLSGSTFPKMHKMPKGFIKLLAHYDIRPCLTDENAVFSYSNSQYDRCNFLFDGECDLISLEEKIRSRFADHFFLIPSRFVNASISILENDIMEIPISEVALKLIRELTRDTIGYVTLSQELTDELIARWKWREFNVKREDLSFKSFPGGEDRDKVRVLAKLNINGLTFEFFFTLKDLEPISLSLPLDPNPANTYFTLRYLNAQKLTINW